MGEGGAGCVVVEARLAKTRVRFFAGPDSLGKAARGRLNYLYEAERGTIACFVRARPVSL